LNSTDNSEIQKQNRTLSCPKSESNRNHVFRVLTWLAASLDDWLAVWLAGWLASLLAGWLAGFLAWFLAGLLFAMVS
jgi:hypothetical protein